MMERKTVKIPQGAPIGPNGAPIYGYIEVQADCMGGLCVHKTGKGARWKWMVTHEKSGLALDRIGAMTKARALDNMQKVLALEFDWNQDEKAALAALRQSRGIFDAITAIGNRH